MSSTNTLARSISLAQAFCNLRPMTNIGGAPNEPAFSNADWVRQFILAPPFAWRWNRAFVSISLIAGQQDYVVNFPTTSPGFGWIEKASILDTIKTPNVLHELNVDLNLSESSAQELPVHVSARLDDGLGNITFRFLPVPFQSYTAIITYQQAAPIFKNINDAWTPIPDYYSYLCNQGFLAKSYEFINDERWGPATQMFVRQVIAANAGLADSQVNIFLGERLNSARQQENIVGTNREGRAGRGAF